MSFFKSKPKTYKANVSISTRHYNTLRVIEKLTTEVIIREDTRTYVELTSQLHRQLRNPDSLELFDRRIPAGVFPGPIHSVYLGDLDLGSRELANKAGRVIGAYRVGSGGTITLDVSFEKPEVGGRPKPNP